MMRVKKNDTVLILSGKDKGKRGVVLTIDPKKNKLKVKGLAIVLRHYKARRSGEVSSIRKQEAYIPCCKVMPVCPSCDKPCRINITVDNAQRKVRVCNNCQAAL